MQAVLKTVVLLGALIGVTAAPAQAEDARLGQGNDSVSANGLTIGALSPTYGVVTLPVSPSDPTSTAMLGAGAMVQDFAARYSTELYGSEIGFFARVADRSVQWAAETSSAFNLGASVGYAGFYLQGAFTGANENSFVRSFQSSQAWQAGLGYGGGRFDVRLTYSMGETSPAFARRSFDNNQWMLGGIYQLSPAIRFNADAFVGTRLVGPGLASAAPTSAPQGTGARVGVQLRF